MGDSKIFSLELSGIQEQFITVTLLSGSSNGHYICYLINTCKYMNMLQFVLFTRVIKSRRLRWAEHIARMEEGRNAFKILTGKPTGKRPLGRPRRRWEDNIRMVLNRYKYEELS